ANNRTVGPPHLARLGVGCYDHGARAMQIRDGLLKLEDKASEADMLAIQLDDRAVFLTRWQGLLLGVVSEKAAGGNTGRERLRAAVVDWGARAAVDSAGFRAVRQFRLEVFQAVLGPLTAPCQRADRTFAYRYLDANVEQSVWLLATQKP